MPRISIAAVDWSGRASGAGEAIWIARVDEHGQLASLENGRDPEQLVNHLVELAKHGSRPVVGLDFAFGFPAWWVRQRGWSHGREIWRAMTGRHARAGRWLADAFDAAVSAIVMGRHRDQLAGLPIVDDAMVRLEGQIWTPA